MTSMEMGQTKLGGGAVPGLRGGYERRGLAAVRPRRRGTPAHAPCRARSTPHASYTPTATHDCFDAELAGRSLEWDGRCERLSSPWSRRASGESASVEASPSSLVTPILSLVRSGSACNAILRLPGRRWSGPLGVEDQRGYGLKPF